MAMLTMMTFNAWSGLTYRGALRMEYFESAADRRARFLALAAEIRRASPDILGLSEANPLPSYARELSALTGMDAVHRMGVSGIRLGPVGIPANLREGDMMLARRELGLRRIGRAWLGGAGWVRNGWSFHTGDVTQALLCSVTVAGGEFFIAQVHLRHAPPMTDATFAALDSLARRYAYSPRQHRAALETLRADTRRKEEEVLRLRNFLARAVPEGALLILMGDFNAEPSWPCMAPLFDAGYRVIAPAAGTNTWDGGRNEIIRRYYSEEAAARHASLYRHLLAVFDTESRMIDFILAAPTLTPERAVSSGPCLTGDGGVALSDHYGVTATIAV